MELLRVGELAQRTTGLTVRTLHHYDELGLLRPARRSTTVSGPGYRHYGSAEVERLKRILLLRRLGLPLEEIGGRLDDAGLALAQTLAIQIARLREEIESSARLRRLETLAARIDRGEGASIEDLTETLEMIAMYEKHFTPEQLRRLEERRAVVTDARIAEIET
jgi:DNA-binding transcriptional MerR regulator